MAGTDDGGSVDPPALASSVVDPILDAKMHRPPTRPDWIERARLMKELDHAVLRPVVLVAAPAGFGKTTMVTQWLASNRGPSMTAWISLDARDNDPFQLWTHVAVALELAGCRPKDDVATSMAAHGGEVIAGVLPQLLGAMGAMEDDLIILLDDFHVLQDPACHRQVEFLVEHLPPQAHLVIITRADPGLRLGRLRATGQLAEIRAAELAFTADEASSMLAVEHVQLSEGSLQDLVHRTEGWAAGIYLATLSMAGRTDPDEFIREVSGGNRFIGDYLTEEVLAGHSDEVRQFIRAVSILDRFSPPLCDFVTGGTGSAAILHDLERTNLFLVPLDESRTWFRFHHLFASVARSELELEHPEQVAALHSRAARWFRENGHVDEAVMHSLASGSTRDAALLVQANWLSYVGSGRTATVLGWLDALGTTVAADPAARVPAAWMAALTGDQKALDDHLLALEEFKHLGPLPDGARSIESAISLIQGLFGYGGPTEMRRGGQRALELETDGRSPFYSMAHQAAGHAAYVDGDLALAGALLAKASHNDAAPAIIRVLALSCWSMAEDERGHHEQSLALAQEAMRVVDHDAVGGMPQASPAFTALGRAQTTSGDLPAAVATVEKGLVLRRKNPAQGPWGNLHHLLAAARVSAAAGELVMAQHLVEEASTRMDKFPEGMECMRDRLHVIQRELDSPLADAPAREPLTDREFDVLRLLQGSLSLNGIAGELYISPNTVKTHAKAVYRKLGVSSRSEAVQIARGRLLV
jgi:LuxR family transcriptional regulator, maltose regulon positive regulatory protein